MLVLLAGCSPEAVEEQPLREPVPSRVQEIVNGTDTTIAANPWQVMVLGYRFCGGSVLNENWVLTAQHCVRDPEGVLRTPEFVVAGSTTMTGGVNGQVSTVAQVITYPGYVDTSQGKDVALLRLSSPLDLSGPNVKAIPLATAVDESSRVTTPGVVGRATGWGRLYVDGPTPETLQTTDLTLQSNSVAQAAYPTYNITADQLAASALGTGICDGDSGGPLTVLNGDTRVLAGVVSWGYGCGEARFPVMSARVSRFEPWINEMTCMLSSGVAQSNISVAANEWTCTYTLSVPAGAREVTFELSGGSGDGDMYVRWGSPPDLFSYNCAPYKFGNEEKCTFASPHAGTWYVRIRGARASAGMRLKGGYSTLLDFGGMWGYVDNGVLAHHPATGSDVCPAGYKPTRVLGTSGRDWDLFLCSRPYQEGREPLYDFGGMWGTVQGAVVPNPLTDKPSCPLGYSAQRVLGSPNVDYDMYVCYKPHQPGTTPDYLFGGMMGQVDGGIVAPNPATGAASCPPGFMYKPVSGTGGVDWSVHFCFIAPTLDFGGMFGFVDNGTLAYNPATGMANCLPGYKATQLLGTVGVDASVFLCSRTHQPGVEPYFDFGGMWGTVQGVLKPNPYTNAASCPVGYLTQRVLGTPNRDYDLYVCYQRHLSKAPPKYPLGGMWGQVNGGTYVPNPVTGSTTCPAGFTDTQVLGTGGVDYELHFCAANP